MAIRIASPTQALEAIAIRQGLSDEGKTSEIVVDNVADWTVSWPLSLVGLAPLGEATSQTIIDLRSDDHEFAEAGDLVAEGAEIVWGPASATAKFAALYVPESLAEYPALDAWVSVALRALVDAGYDSQIVADPGARHALSGWRSSIVSFDEIRNSGVVVTTAAPEGKISQLAPVVVFDPSDQSGTSARTAAELRVALEAQG